MSWGTDFETSIFLSRMKFRSKYELDDTITIFQRVIQDCHEKLLMYSVSNIKDITPDEIDSPIEWIHNQVSETIKELEENYKILIELNYYLESNPEFKQDE